MRCRLGVFGHFVAGVGYWVEYLYLDPDLYLYPAVSQKAVAW